MELELGLKITKTKGDLTSTTNFKMSKDSSGPIFMSTETETHFILSAHLKGYEKENIKIKINEDGSEIVIRMEKGVEEMVISDWSVHKKELEMRGFIKAFRIPSGIVLDRIKAMFNDHDSVLTISMLKSVKGVRGERVKEVKELVEESRQGLIANKTEDVRTSRLEEKPNEEEIVKCTLAQERVLEDQATKVEDKLKAEIKSRDGNNRQEEEEVTGGSEEEKIKQNPDGDGEKESDRIVEADQSCNSKKEEITNNNNNMVNNKESSRKIKLCKPCVLAGSSILVSLIIFAIHWIRSKKRQVQ